MIIVEDHEAREVQPSKRTERQVRVIREIAGDLMENVFQIPHSLRIYLGDERENALRHRGLVI